MNRRSFLAALAAGFVVGPEGLWKPKHYVNGCDAPTDFVLTVDEWPNNRIILEGWFEKREAMWSAHLKRISVENQDLIADVLNRTCLGFSNEPLYSSEDKLRILAAV